MLGRNPALTIGVCAAVGRKSVNGGSGEVVEVPAAAVAAVAAVTAVTGVLHLGTRVGKRVLQLAFVTTFVETDASATRSATHNRGHVTVTHIRDELFHRAARSIRYCSRRHRSGNAQRFTRRSDG